MRAVLISYWDAVLYVPFLIGYTLFALYMAGNAMRSSLNHITTRWAYLSRNIDTFGARLIPGTIIFGLSQHANAVATYIGHPVPFQIPSGAIAMLGLGFFSNAIVDGFSALPRVPILGWPIPQIIKDNIPVIPTNGTKNGGSDGANKND